MKPPEDAREPAWLGDYRAIEADIRQLADLAAALDAEVRQNYIPHLAAIDEDLTVQLPPPPAEFVELCAFLDTHRTAQINTASNTYAFRDATAGFARAAGEVSRRYAGSDAFAAARVSDIRTALDGTAVARLPEPTDD